MGKVLQLNLAREMTEHDARFLRTLDSQLRSVEHIHKPHEYRPWLRDVYLETFSDRKLT